MDHRSTTGVQSVQLAIDVLEAVAFSGEELGVTQIAERLSVTKGSVHRHLSTLVERGYLAQNPITSRYSLGPKSRLLARVAPAVDLVQVAEGPMRTLRDELGHSVVLSASTPRGALVLTTIAGSSPIEIGVRTGSELSLIASAQGRLLLAYAPKAAQERALTRPMQRHTAKTVVEPRLLQAELGRIPRQGYASAPEQMLLGINAIAAPLFDASNRCVGCITIVGSIQILPAHPDDSTIAALTTAAEQISRRLGPDKSPAIDGLPEAAGKRRKAS
jgi:IclR family KDG regulon transcriptional repressor